MKKFLVSSLAIVGMVILVGCGGGSSTPSNPETPPNSGTPSNPDTPSNPVTPSSSGNSLVMTKIDNNHFTVKWINNYNLQSGVEYSTDAVGEQPFLMAFSPGEQIADCIGEPEVDNQKPFTCDVSGSSATLHLAQITFTNNISYSFYRLHTESNGGIPEVIRGDIEYFISYTNGELTGF